MKQQPFLLILGFTLLSVQFVGAKEQPADAHEHHADMHMSSGSPAAMHEHHAGMHMSAEDHAAHLAMLHDTHYSVSENDYKIPDVELVDENGVVTKLSAILDSDEPVALNFIFTTCSTICPVMTATFAQLQRKLGDDAAHLRLVSISIDPEYDRPDILKTYSKKFHAGGNWVFLTGDSRDVINVQQHFDTFGGSKLNHKPVTLLRKSPGSQWLRVDGFASASDLAKLVEQQLLN